MSYATVVDMLYACEIACIDLNSARQWDLLQHIDNNYMLMTPKPILTMYFEAIYLFFLHFNINGFTTNANSHILLNVT